MDEMNVRRETISIFKFWLQIFFFSNSYNDDRDSISEKLNDDPKMI